MTPLRVAVCSDYVEEGWPSMDRVGRRLLAALASHHGGNICAQDVRPAFVRRAARLGAGLAAANIDRGVNRLFDYPRRVGRLGADFDVFHIIDHSYSQLAHRLPAGRVIITCHDLDTFESVLAPDANPRSWAFQAMTRHILRGFARAATVACCTSAIKGEIVAYGLMPEERVLVVPNGVGDEFSPVADPEADAAAARLLGPAGPLDVLHVGSTIPRKRIDLLLRIFHELRRAHPEARLVRVGGPLTSEQTRVASDLGVKEAIVELPHIDDRLLAAVYRRACVTVLPSAREGFGFPVVESLRCGTPVVAADLAVLREVGGVEASYCALDDIDGWVRTILASRPSDPDVARARSLAGVAWSGRYTWGRYADQIARVYEAVAERRAAPELVHSLV